MLLRDSRHKEAQAGLADLRRVKLSSEELIRFASLCGRAGVPEFGVVKLRSVVHGTNRKKPTAEPQHLLEYANCLVLVGAMREAESILRPIQKLDLPGFHKTMAYLRIREWDYHLAIAPLKAHLQTLAAGSYESTVCKINLAIALNFEGLTNEAAVIPNDIIAAQENFQYPNLKGNCFRILGFIEFNRGNYEVALQCFQKAYAVFGGHPGQDTGLDAFLARKWIGLAQYCMEKGSPLSKVMLDSLQQEAVVRKHWETVRDIEYQLGSFHQDEEILVKIYYGTSYQHFKDRLRKRFPNLQIPESYLWRLGTGKNGGIPEFQLMQSNLKPGGVVYNLMSVLTSDFYRSFKPLDLFQKLYPGEFYSIGSSEQKVHQSITRLRRQFETEKIPFIIDSEDGLFRLSPESPFHIRVFERTQGITSVNDFRIAQMKEKFQNRTFNINETKSLLGVARSAANEFLSDLVEAGKLVRMGKGKNTGYAFPEESVEKKQAA